MHLLLKRSQPVCQHILLFMNTNQMPSDHLSLQIIVYIQITATQSCPAQGIGSISIAIKAGTA